MRDELYDCPLVVIFSIFNFSMDGKRVVSGGGYDDRSVRVWDVERGQVIENALYGHASWVDCVNFSMDARRVVSGGGGMECDWIVHVWDVLVK